MTNQINIAIDGYSSCGKSTLAKDLAKSLNYTYIDSGAMYRAVTLYLLENGFIDSSGNPNVEASLKNIDIHFKTENGISSTYLNGQNVEEKIRSMEISQHVSTVAAISSVRTKLVKIQQNLGLHKGLVMDGRDIGTVVFPDAELKLFITAELEVRTIRRLQELLEKGFRVDEKSVKENLRHRDFIDSTREDSPLMQAEDAILIDNTNLSREEQLQKAIEYAHEIIGKTGSR